MYESILDSWVLIDNSKSKPILIAKRRNGDREVIDQKLFDGIQKVAR